MNDTTAAIERVVGLAEGFRKAIEEETGILYTGENIQKISTLIHLKKGKIDAERILDMTDREILISLKEDAKKANKYIKGPDQTGLTMREECLINLYKSRAGYEKRWTRKSLDKSKKSGSFITIFYSTEKGGKQKKNFKPPTKKELQKIIEHLKGFPLAQKPAINDLDELP